jgi:hypothetical protein
VLLSLETWHRTRWQPIKAAPRPRGTAVGVETPAQCRDKAGVLVELQEQAQAACSDGGVGLVEDKDMDVDGEVRVE